MTKEQQELRPLSDIPEGLLEDLNARFPERCPDIGHTTEEVWYMSGQRSVIRFLIQHFAEQREIKLRGD